MRGWLWGRVPHVLLHCPRVSALSLRVPSWGARPIYSGVALGLPKDGVRPAGDRARSRAVPGARRERQGAGPDLMGSPPTARRDGSFRQKLLGEQIPPTGPLSTSRQATIPVLAPLLLSRKEFLSWRLCD